MAAIKQDKRIRRIDIGRKAQRAATGNSQFEIGKLPALVNFITHVPFKFPEKGTIILVVTE